MRHGPFELQELGWRWLVNFAPEGALGKKPAGRITDGARRCCPEYSFSRRAASMVMSLV